MIQACDSHLSTEICFIADVDTTLARQSVFARLAGALRPQVQVGNSVAANYSSCSAACCPRDAAHWDGHGGPMAVTSGASTPSLRRARAGAPRDIYAVPGPGPGPGGPSPAAQAARQGLACWAHGVGGRFPTLLARIIELEYILPLHICILGLIQRVTAVYRRYLPTVPSKSCPAAT